MIAVVVAGIGISAYYAGQHNLKLAVAPTPERADRRKMVRFRGAWTPSAFAPPVRNVVSGTCVPTDGVCVLAETVIDGRTVRTSADLYKLQSPAGSRIVAISQTSCSVETLTIDIQAGTIERYFHRQVAPGLDGPWPCGDVGFPDYIQHLDDATVEMTPP